MQSRDLLELKAKPLLIKKLKYIYIKALLYEA